VHFGDRDVTFLPPHKRNIGVVFQSYALFPHMDVAQNVAFPLRARRVPKAAWSARVRDALALVGLAGFEERGIGQLSGGQRQRVALARAIIFEPQLILMDEPLSALDKQLRESMQIELRQLHKRIGATIIYVTHDQREALTMSDRVAVLRNGKLVQVDKAERLHDHPADSFVAGFIGEATLLPVKRAGSDSVSLGETVLRTGRPIPDSSDLFLAVHTEKLLIDDGANSSGRNRLSGSVTDVVFQGESLRIFLALDDGSALSLRQPSHFEAARLVPQIGARLNVSLHPEDTIVVAKAVA
jgi:putative spermidine/putrescine transport system ATP-binding protein